MKRILSPLAVAALALSLAACGSDDDSTSASGVKTVQDGKLTICTDAPFAPFEYEDASTPTGFTGFDIDIATAIADDLELELAVAPTGFDAVQSGTALNAGQCDMGASAITINEDRKATIDFSDPYLDSEQSLLVPADSDVKTLADLKGKKIGTMGTSTGEKYATANAKDADIVSFPDDGKMFQALKAKQVDALLQDIEVNALHQTDGTFTIVETYPTGESYGLAVKKGNTELLEAVNESLQGLRDSKKYDEIHAEYFGS
ncbi:ABC transporter substrate-binding protein [Nocardioides yefusunii]|uniref:ABC transporter substrate-binding protein n=1 Tax=Nocardioides yefusunii TaxID=2500546 RepID=A0ABW1QVQ7_9ACTN|nr:ABC transporter substrate-binding protein [Nocardioides yefusunii]